MNYIKYVLVALGVVIFILIALVLNGCAAMKVTWGTCNMGFKHVIASGNVKHVKTDEGAELDRTEPHKIFDNTTVKY